MVEVAVTPGAVHDRGAGVCGEKGEVLEVSIGELVHVSEQPALVSVIFEPLLERGAVSAIVHGASDAREELVEWARGLVEHVPLFRRFSDVGGEEQVKLISTLCGELEKRCGGSVGRVRIQSGLTQRVAPIAEEAEGTFDHLFWGVSVSNIDHLVAPPRSNGRWGHMGHKLRERLHGADCGCSESERFFEPSADGVEAHCWVELPFDGVQFLNPVSETLRSADGEAHRRVIEVGMCVDETGQEGGGTHVQNRRVRRERGHAILVPAPRCRDEATLDNDSGIAKKPSIGAPESACSEGDWRVVFGVVGWIGHGFRRRGSSHGAAGSIAAAARSRFFTTSRALATRMLQASWHSRGMREGSSW